MHQNIRLTQSTTATVAATRQETRPYGTSTREALLPTVRFETQDGRMVETELSMWPWELPNYGSAMSRWLWKVSPLIEVGDELPVVYDPQRPESAQLESVELHRRHGAQRAQRYCLIMVGIIVIALLMFLLFVLFLLLAAGS
jgi:hypothetical protein